MRLNSRCVVVALSVGTVVDLAGTTAQAHILSDWNLIVRNNVDSNSEVDGSAIIGGSLSGDSANFSIQGVTAPGNVGLAIAGNINGNPKQINQGGNLRYSGSGSNSTNMNGGGQRIFDNTISSQVSNLMTEATNIRNHLASLPANSLLSVNGNAGTFNAAPVLIQGQRVAVFSLNTSAFSGLAQLGLAVNNADSIIINITNSGSTTIQSPPNFVSEFSQSISSKIIWNFPNATQVNIGGNFTGSVLAPQAALSVSNGGIYGTVVVDHIPSQRAEIRRFTYQGYIPTPGAGALLAIGGLVAIRRRRVVG